MARNYNKVILRAIFDDILNEDKDGNFRIIGLSNTKVDYYTYFIVNELYSHNNKNVIYYKNNIHDLLFYDERSQFIIKRKEIYEIIQKLNLSISRLKHIIKIKYKQSKNKINLIGDVLKKKNISIIEDHTKYSFDYFEMYNIVASAFKQLNDGTPIILNIRNPYTNKKLSHYNIVNIYFLLMANGRIPKYFYLYFHENFSKKEIYNKYNINLFIDVIKYNYKQLSIENKIIYINRLLECHNYNSFIRKNEKFKIEYLDGIAINFYVALRIIYQYGDEQYDIYSEYFERCKTDLIKLRKTQSVKFTNTYIVKDNH